MADPAAIVQRYPRLFHLTHIDNVESIRRLGLLSTSALLVVTQELFPSVLTLLGERSRDTV